MCVCFGGGGCPEYLALQTPGGVRMHPLSRDFLPHYSVEMHISLLCPGGWEDSDHSKDSPAAVHAVPVGSRLHEGWSAVLVLEGVEIRG